MQCSLVFCIDEWEFLFTCNEPFSKNVDLQRLAWSCQLVLAIPELHVRRGSRFCSWSILSSFVRQEKFCRKEMAADFTRNSDCDASQSQEMQCSRFLACTIQFYTSERIETVCGACGACVVLAWWRERGRYVWNCASREECVFGHDASRWQQADAPSTNLARVRPAHNVSESNAH